MYEEFCADCKREMWKRRMTNGMLAKETGYTKSTINAFFSDIAKRDKSPKVAEAISTVLGVECQKRKLEGR